MTTAELAQKYGGVTAQTSNPAPTKIGSKKKKSVLEKVQGFGDFLGISKFGQGLSTLGSNIADEQANQAAQNTSNVSRLLQIYNKTKDTKKKTQLAQVIKAMGTDVSAGEINSGYNLSTKEVIGSAGNVALNIATVGMGPAQGATGGARIANSAMKFGTTGAAFGAAQAMNENKDLNSIIRQAATSGLIAGGIGIGVQGLAEFGKILTSRGVTEGIINKNLGVSKAMRQKGRTPGKQIIDEGMVGSKRGLLRKSETEISSMKQVIDKELSQNNILHRTDDLVTSMKGQLREIYSDALGPDEIDNLVDNLPIHALRDNTAMTIDRINKLREIIDNKFLGNKKWLNSSMAQPERVTALKVAANVLRTKVQTEVPATIPAFQRMSKAIQLKTVLDDSLAKPHILTNMIEGMFSGSAGLAIGGLTAGGAGQAAAIFGLIKILTSTPTATGLGVGLNKLGQLGSSQFMKNASSISRIGTQRIIQEVQ